MKIPSCLTAMAAFALLAIPTGVQADTTSTALGSLAYRSIGPAISGGRTTAVAGSDRDPSVYYAGGANGGVWKSIDGGVSWHPVFDRQPTAAIGAIAVSPLDPNDVWVGTGEAYPRNDVEEGDGLWHSRDGGKSWTHAGLDDAGSIATISIDPRDPKNVAVGVLGHVFRDGTTRGVYVTHDGKSFTRTLYIGPASGISDLTRVPDRPATLFAGVWQFRREPWKMTSGGPSGGLYRSDDNGTTWQKVSGHGFASGLTGRIGVTAGKNGRVYAIVQSRQGDIWRSDDTGRTWRVMPHDPYVGARSFYFTRLYVDPADHDRLISVSLILSMSTNGARSFHKIATNAGWDYHATWWSSNGRRIIFGSDEGVTLSANGGGAWSQPYALPFAQPYHVGFENAAPSYRVCTGLQDNSTWCGPATADNGLGVLNRDWYTVGPGDGMYALFDPLDPHFIWSTSTNNDPGQVYVFDERTKQTRDISPDSEIDSRLLATKAHRMNWDSPLAFTADGKALVGGEVVFQSSDRGAHWTAISPDLTRNEKAHQQISGGPIGDDVSGAENYDTILRIAPSKVDLKLIWVGTDDGLIQLTRDSGATWSNVTSPLFPRNGRVYTIDPGNGDAGVAYAAIDNHMLGDDRPHLFRTGDYGASWTSIVGDLPPDLFTRAIREDLKNANVLYAGTRRGVFVSFDRGTRWHPLRLNMPATAIYDLQIVPQTNDLLVAAHGRGIWVLDDLRPLQEFATTQTATLALFTPTVAYRMFQYSPVNAFTDGSLPDGDFVGANRRFGAILSYYVARPAKTIALTITDSTGAIVKHIAGKALTSHAGMNRLAWDLAEDGPTPWTSTFEQNKGPKTGAEVVPGTYKAHLLVDGVTRETTIAVKLDPRDTSSATEVQARHDDLTEINGELSDVDAMLNAIDLRLKNAQPADAATLRALRARLTVDPHNIEDLKTTAQVREGLLDLLGRIGATSFQSATESQRTEGLRLRRLYEGVAADGRSLGLLAAPKAPGSSVFERQR